MALSCIISEIKRDVGRKSLFFIPSAFDAVVGWGVRRNIAIRFDINQSISLIAELRPEGRIANEMQLK